jgi:hypothetical protein
MRLKVYKNQSEKSGLLGGKKYVYSLKIIAEMTNEETQVLNKYGYLTEIFIIDPEISANIEVRKEAKGPHQISVNELQKGIEWSCEHLPVYFANIPTAVHSQVEKLLGAALARENWSGEEVIET